VNLDVPPMPALLAANVAFGALCAAIVLAVRMMPWTASVGQALTGLLISEIVIIALAIGPLALGGPLLAAGLALLAGRCAWEAARVLLPSPDANRYVALASGFATGSAVLAISLLPAPWSIAALPALSAVLAAIWLRVERGLTAFTALVAFPVLPLLAFALTAARPGGPAMLALAFLLVEIFDSASLLGGKLFGRRPVFPRLSPRKTREGLLFGALALILASLVLFAGVFSIWKAHEAALVALVVIAAAMAGDLTASAVKRWRGVKDFPPVHPVQGGALDIADAWIVTAPVLAATVLAA
jgi:phosphatidate cytidylyltransferase